MEREKRLDFDEQMHSYGKILSDKPIKDLKYDELLEVLNRDHEAMKALSGKKGAQV